MDNGLKDAGRQYLATLSMTHEHKSFDLLNRYITRTESAPTDSSSLVYSLVRAH